MLVGKSWQQKSKAADHMSTIVSKQGARNAAVLPVFTLSLSLEVKVGLPGLHSVAMVNTMANNGLGGKGVILVYRL